MLERLPVRRHVRRLAPLALAAALLSTIPGLSSPPALAQTTITQALDDTQIDFAKGTFQRTAVVAGVVPDDPRPFPDTDGIVELGSVGNLKPWTATFPDLPTPLSSMGVATIGPRLYVVGGATAGTDVFASTAYWANLNQQTGAIATHNLTTPPTGATLFNEWWVNDPMPSIRAFMTLSPRGTTACNNDLISTRSSPAVASFVTGTGTDYIYTVGGTYVLGSTCGVGTVSSPAVQRGSVISATGDIAWTQGDQLMSNYLPSPGFTRQDGEDWDPGNDGTLPPPINLNGDAVGVAGATATVVTTAAGRTFLYVIGGRSSFVNNRGAREVQVTPAVFYTRLNATTGAFEHPTGAATGTPWARTANVPINLVQSDPFNVPPPGELGIYGHTAIASQGLQGVGAAAKVTSAIYVTGGYVDQPNQSVPSTAQATVFRATIDDTTGALTWSTTPNGSGANKVTLGQGRAGLGGFAFGNKLYILGGTPRSDTGPTGTSPLGTGLLGAHDDNLNLLDLYGPLIYFSGNPSVNVIAPTFNLGTAVIQAAPPPNATTIQNTGWGYTIGGIDGATNAPTSKIYRGLLGGGEEGEQTARIPDGWYYSRLFNIRLESENTEARILSIRWGVGLNRGLNPGADLRLEFQRTRNLPCNEAAFAGSPWVPLDGDTAEESFSSKNGFNEVKLSEVFPTQDFLASCVRYRVYLTQNGNNAIGPNPPGAGGEQISPQLFNVSVEKIKPGDPDLKLEKFEIGPDSSGRIATFDLQIKNLNDNLQNTVAVTGGQFPVVLCVAYSEPGQPAPTLTLPDLPIAGDTDGRVNCAPIYRWVDPSETIPGQVFTLNNTWRVNFPFPTSAHLPEGIGQDVALSDPKEAFAKPGNYAVAVLLDPFGLKAETTAARANNRGENLPLASPSGQPAIRTFTITAAGFDRSVRLPLVAR